MKFIEKKIKQIVDRIVLRVTYFLLGGVLIVCLLTMLLPSLMLPLFARPLIRADHPEPHAGAVIVLGGDPTIRVEPAARAVLAGYGPKLFLVDCQSNHLENAGFIPKEADMTVQIAERSGLQKNQMEVLRASGRATSTFDEAKAYRDFFTVHPPEPKRVVVITSWPHSQRAGWILDKALNPLGIIVEMKPVDLVPFSFDEWWKSEEGMIFVFEEYVKWGRYLAKYAGRTIPE